MVWLWRALGAGCAASPAGPAPDLACALGFLTRTSLLFAADLLDRPALRIWQLAGAGLLAGALAGC